MQIFRRVHRKISNYDVQAKLELDVQIKNFRIKDYPYFERDPNILGKILSEL